MTVVTRALGALGDRVLGLEPGTVPYDLAKDVPVPMPDGVVLMGDHYRPQEQTGPAPVILVRTPYGRPLGHLCFAAPLARHGFQVFLQRVRGTFGSGGQFLPFTAERADGLATLAWLRAQPWCDGRVATTGASYFGHTQWAIAPYADPPLEAMAAHITSSRMTDTFYPGGAPTLFNGLSWTSTIGNQERGGPFYDPRRKPRLQRAIHKMPLQAADVAVAGAPVGFWRDFTGHGEPGDPYWGETYGAPATSDVVPPTSMVTGWWDLFVAAQLHDFAELRAKGVDARIVVGPWLHGEFGELREVVRSDLEFFRHRLGGGPAPTGARVRLHLQEAEQWLEFDAWPPPATTETLTLGDTVSGEVSAFVYDPSDPTPAIGGPLLAPPGKSVDQAPVETRPDVLLFTGPPLAADLDVVGAPTARLFVRPEREYADVYVRICDVDDKGVSRNIVDGIRRLDPRTVPAKDVELGEDGVFAVDIELFPTAYRVRAGHRIRVQVSGGAFPRFARNTGNGEPFGAATTGLTCRTEILHDAAHPSAVTLPVLGG